MASNGLHIQMKPVFSIYDRFFTTLLGLLVATTSYADPAQEYKMKTAFLYNFIQLTEWPKTTDTPLRLCIFEQDPISEALQGLEGVEAGGRRIKVIHLTSIDAANTCETLYLGEPEPDVIKNILSKLGESPVLTISDNMDLAKSGVMITMYPESRRLVFRVNIASTKHAHLTLSSRLLQLARHVD